MRGATSLAGLDAAAIRVARRRVAPILNPTPLIFSPRLDALAGRRLLFKPECLQPTGAFKLRGAENAIALLPEKARRAGIVTLSSGNHAQGVALAARRAGIRATIFMPADAPAAKMAGVRALGAEIITHDRETEDREALVVRFMADTGARFIHPYDDAAVIAGQGTVGLEIAEDAARHGIRHGTVLVPAGGGGLAAGITLALAEAAPALEVQTVEPEGFDDIRRSLASGRREANAARSGSICDAILTPSPGRLTLPVLVARAGPGIAVSDSETLIAMGLILRHLRLVVEPAAATPLAAVLFHGDALTGGAERPAILVLTGGNVDPAFLPRAVAAATRWESQRERGGIPGKQDERNNEQDDAV